MLSNGGEGVENPRGNSNRIKYQSYTGVWVNYTLKNPKSRGFDGWGLNCHNIYTSIFEYARISTAVSCNVSYIYQRIKL